MPEKRLYEYAVIRIVPRVEREEFVNAGIVLFCKENGFLQCLTSLPEQKLQCLAPEINLLQIKENLSAFEQIALGKNANSKISQLDAASRFRWLTAVRSTVIQCSKVHPGLSLSLEEELKILFEKHVQ